MSDASPFSKSDWAIMCAVDAGYSADACGNIYTPSGRLLSNRSAKRGGHLSISLRDQNGKCKPVLAHRLVAYFFYGVDALLAQCVRHLNDVPNDNRKENLAYGTHKENRADIPSEKLSEIGKAHAEAFVARSRKLTDEQVRRMRLLRAECKTPYHKLAKQFGVTTMTAYRAVVKQSWGNIA